jgi:uncharacterized protein YraI
LQVGERARVVIEGDDRSNRIRNGAGTGFDEIGRIPPGAEFDVLEGPVCNDGYAWWRVEYNGLIGWTAESDEVTYWLEPLDGEAIAATALPDENLCRIVTTEEVNLRRGPGTNYERAGTLPANETFVVIGQFTNESGFVWYKLENNFWVREDVITLQGDCTNVPYTR